MGSLRRRKKNRYQQLLYVQLFTEINETINLNLQPLYKGCLTGKNYPKCDLDCSLIITVNIILMVIIQTLHTLKFIISSLSSHLPSFRLYCYAVIGAAVNMLSLVVMATVWTSTHLCNHAVCLVAQNSRRVPGT